MFDYVFIGILYFLSILAYGWSAYITISMELNKQLTYILIAWGLVNVANIGWFIVARLMSTTKNVYLAGVIFDMLLSLAFIIPPLFLNKTLHGTITPTFVLGIILTLIGLLIIKLG